MHPPKYELRATRQKWAQVGDDDIVPNPRGHKSILYGQQNSCIVGEVNNETSDIAVAQS
jgi:hypothetical protein